MRFLAALFLSSFGGIALAAKPINPSTNVDELITDLSSNSYDFREDATRQLWQLGEAALEKLRAAVNSDDPEAAFRAAGLVRKIENHITPDTDPAVIELVERYLTAGRDEKPDILTEIRNRRGWFQALKLYAAETDPILRESFGPEAHAIALLAAREKLTADKPNEAREFLELAPRDSQSLMALAAFHRSQGTLDAELEKAKKLPAAESAAWRAALYRAKGDIPAARQAAVEAHDEILAASLALFDGDPLPWFAYKGKKDESNAARKFYLKYVNGQWGKGDTPGLEPAMQLLGSRDGQQRTAAANLLFLIGKPRLAEVVFVKASPEQASSYFEGTERVQEAISALGLDAAKPDYQAWAAERFARILKEEDDGSKSTLELIRLAAVVGQLGLSAELQSAYEAPLLKLAVENEETFLTFMQALFLEERSNKPAVSLARNTAAKWAGEDAARWRSLIASAVDDDPMVREWWEWMADLDPAAGFTERFDGLLGLLEISADPKKLNRHWLELAWKAVDKAPDKEQVKLLKRIGFMFDPSARTGRAGDIAAAMKIWDRLDPKDRGDPIQSLSYLGFAAAGRWQEAADIFETMIARDAGSGAAASRVFLLAYAASSLRRADREKDALTYDAWVEKLALADPGTAKFISQGYDYGGDSARAKLWISRAAIEATPGADGNEEYFTAYADSLLEQGNWKVSAALAEAVALEAAGQDLGPAAPFALINLRLKADLPHALALLPDDRPRALAMLENCHSMFPAGGTLADDFFPALRKAGLMKEHDAWFEASWQVFSKLIAAYPNSERLRNGAAWLGARSGRRLDEAEKHATAALALNPDQAAYLDTMAEVHFAQRDRKAALKWSGQAVNFGASDPQIRRQYERFRKDPLPAN
jgi:hypothetical protein